MGRMIHFEITADDPGRAAEFYKQAFGWEIKKWDGPTDYWLASTGEDNTPGINGAIMPRVYEQPTINTVDVADLDASIKLVEEAGGETINEKQDIPGIGSFIYARDTEGNVFGMMQALEPKPDEGA